MLTVRFLAETLLGSGSDRGLEEVPITDAVVDSRECRPGSVFFALKGEHADGHDFVCDAVRRGAVAVVVRRDKADDCQRAIRALAVGESRRPTAVVPVGDVLVALQRVAACWRRQLAVCVVGVTGSVGKTLTREVIAAVVASQFSVLSSKRNYNNEIGLPLTLLNLRPWHQYAVLEMGMYALGEIEVLASMSLPRIGVVTNVGPTHLERLGSIERIAQAKSELVRSLPSDGIAVLNGDDQRVRQMRSLGPRKAVLFGLRPGNDFRAESVRTHGLEGISFEVEAGDKRRRFRVPLPGEHSVYPALAAISVGQVLGISWSDIERALLHSRDASRLQVRQADNEIRVLDDTYNAAPVSVSAALRILRGQPGRRVAVLGDMLELGEYSERGHREVGREVVHCADVLVAVGKLSRWVADEAVRRGMSGSAVHVADDNRQALARLRMILGGGETVLVKGSRGMAMEQIVEGLVSPLSET